jgi:hypothetical protein
LIAAGLDGMRQTIREKEPVRPSTRLALLGEELTATARRRGAEAPKLVNLLEGDLDWIVMKCLEKDRTRRYETANGLAMDLKRHLNSELVLARPASRWYRFQKAWHRHRLAFTASAFFALVLTAACCLVTFALLEKQAALRSLIKSDQERAVERVRFAILSGDVDRTEQALQHAEEARLPEAKLRFLRGLHLVSTAQAARAIPELKAVLAIETNNVAALGLLATAVGTSAGWSEYELLVPRLEIARPVTPDDLLFLGQALAMRSIYEVRCFSPETIRNRKYFFAGWAERGGSGRPRWESRL